MRVRKTKINRKRRNRHKTMRGGFRDTNDACSQIRGAPTKEAAAKIQRKASLQFHPDRPGGSVEAMQKVNNCFDEKYPPEADLEPGTPAAPAPAPAPAPAEPEWGYRQPRNYFDPRNWQGGPGLNIPPPPRARPAPAAPAAAVGPQYSERIGFAVIPKGTDARTLNPGGRDPGKLGNMIKTAYAEHPEEVMNLILRCSTVIVISIDPGVTENEFINHLRADGMTDEEIVEIGNNMQELYPDISFPTTRQYDIMLFI